MEIQATGYTLKVSESELFDLIFCIKDSLQKPSKIEHCQQHRGWQTFVDNYAQELNMMEYMCKRVGRPDYYESACCEIREMLRKAEKAGQE